MDSSRVQNSNPDPYPFVPYPWQSLVKAVNAVTKIEIEQDSKHILIVALALKLVLGIVNSGVEEASVFHSLLGAGVSGFPLFGCFLDHLLEGKGVELYWKVPEAVVLHIVGLLVDGVWVPVVNCSTYVCCQVAM